MALEQMSFHHYVIEAFNRKPRVPLLGGLPLNKMLIGLAAVLGLDDEERATSGDPLR